MCFNIAMVTPGYFDVLGMLFNGRTATRITMRYHEVGGVFDVVNHRVSFCNNAIATLFMSPVLSLSVYGV
jgi:hypothetical protein